jgi:type I restriction enzyme M protein
MPVAVRPTSLESAYIQYALTQVKQSLVAVVAPGFLFKTAGTDRDLKQYLIEKGYVKSVIRLPNKVFLNTTVAPNLLILDKTKHHENVVFIDASGEEFCAEATRSHVVLKNVDGIISLVNACTSGKTCRVVDKTELEENDYNLDVSRYVKSPEERNLDAFFQNKEVRKLQDIAEIMRAQAIKTDSMGTEIVEINPSDIQKTGYACGSGKYGFVDEKVLNRIDKQRLKPGDVVLAVKGSIGRVGIVPDNAGDKLYAGQSFVILRLRPTSPLKDPIVLYSYLASSIIQKIINSMASGATVRMIKMQDINSLPVVIPGMKEQEAITEDHNKVLRMYDEIASIENEISHLKERLWAN